MLVPGVAHEGSLMLVMVVAFCTVDLLCMISGTGRKVMIHESKCHWD